MMKTMWAVIGDHRFGQYTAGQFTVLEELDDGYKVDIGGSAFFMLKEGMFDTEEEALASCNIRREYISQ